MDIIRNDDGSLIVLVVPGRHSKEDAELPDGGAPTTQVLRPGEGGYIEALSEWDGQQVGSHAATSTATGREHAMAIVHAVAEDPQHDVSKAAHSLDDPEASAEALRHVLAGGQNSVKGFADEIAEAEGGDVIPAHKVTKMIGEVLAEFDS